MKCTRCGGLMAYERFWSEELKIFLVSLPFSGPWLHPSLITMSMVEAWTALNCQPLFILLIFSSKLVDSYPRKRFIEP